MNIKLLNYVYSNQNQLHIYENKVHSVTHILVADVFLLAIIYITKINLNELHTKSAFSFAKIAGSVTFLLYGLECFFLNDVLIQLILDFKKSFVKYYPVCPKNP